MTDLTRRASFLLGLGILGAGPAVLAANAAAAAAAFGPGYVWRFLAWGRRETPVNDALFPRRPIPSGAAPRPLPAAPDPARIARAFASIDPRRPGPRLPLDAFLQQTQTNALLIAQDDRIVFEAYANGAGPSTTRNCRSMAKSVLALLAGIAIADGRIPGVDTPLETLLPDIHGLRGSGVTLLHALQMGDGLAFRGDGDPLGPFTIEPLWSGVRVSYFVPGLRQYLATAHPGTPPNRRFAYNDQSAMLVGLVLERAFGRPLRDVLGERLWTPMGAEFPATWILNDATDGLEKAESGIDAPARDWLKLGQTVLHDGAGLVPPAWIAAMTRPIAPLPPGYYDNNREFALYPGQFYGRFWWGFERPGSTGPGATRPDSFAHGLFGQVVYVCPTHRMTLVRTGIDWGGVQHWPALLRDLANALAAT